MVVAGCHCSPTVNHAAYLGSVFSDHIPLLTIRAYTVIIGTRGLDRQEALIPFGIPNERAELRAHFRSEYRTFFRTDWVTRPVL